VSDAYAALAAIYDEWQGQDGFSSQVLQRLEPLLAQRASTGSFADVGCGTGELLLRLADAHPRWRLLGVDASAEMLARAREKPGARRIDWRRLALGAPLPGPPFDAAGAFFNTLNHLDDLAELGAAFRALAAALAPGGLLAFDVNNALGFQTWWQGRHRYEGSSWTLDVATDFDRATGRAAAHMRIARGRRDRDVCRVDLVERYFPTVDIATVLREAGFALRTAEPWAPLTDGVPGATFWTAIRR